MSKSSLSQSLLAIYDAALSETRWQPALHMLAREAGALGAILLANDQVGLPYQVEQSSYPIESVRYYFDNFGEFDRQVMNGPARVHPPFTLLRDVDVWGDGDALQSRPDFMWLAGAIGAKRRALVRLSADTGLVDLLGLQFDTPWENRSQQSEDNLQLLLPHLAQVLRMNRRFSILRQRYQAALAALDQIRIGTCVMGGDGEVVVSNGEARRIFDLADGVRLLPSGKLDFSRDLETGRFKAAVRSMGATARGEDCGREVVFVAPRRSQQQPYIVEVTPLRDSSAELSPGFHGAMAYIIDPLNLANISVSRLAKLFDLTTAETEVCQMMMDGLSAGEVAERRNVAEGTVKTQFRAIYAKTGVGRRVELIRLALTVDPPIR